jgi:hypothetical protein
MPEKMRFFMPIIVSADWHLEEQAWKGHNELHGDAYHALEQIVDLCLANGAPLIGAGDLNETTTPDAATVKTAVKQIDRLCLAKLPFLYVTGQHDGVRGHVQWMDLHDWSMPLDRRVAIVDGVKYYGLNYRPAELLADELKKIPLDVQVLVCHQAWLEPGSAKARPRRSLPILKRNWGSSGSGWPPWIRRKASWLARPAARRRARPAWCS